MIDIIVGGIVAILVGAALFYIRKEKKRGAVCIGCPNAGTCQKHSHAEQGCTCHTEE